MSAQEQLKELLGYESAIKKCAGQNDSTHAFLLQRIGAAYYKQSDYVHAVQFTRQAINLVVANGHNPSVNANHLIRYYYALSVFYDSLNRVADEMKAIDSCIATAIKANAVNEFALYTLYHRVEYLNDIGDYDRCISYADMGEKITRLYSHSKDSITYITDFLVFKVNGLLIMKKYDSAEKLLINKAEEFKKSGITENLGAILDQLATVQLQRGDYAKALFYFQQSLRYEKKINHLFGYAQTLNNIGYNLYAQKLNEYDKAIEYYSASYKYAKKSLSNPRPGEASKISIELSNILSNIANAYTKKKLYDSALYFFKKAFEQVSPDANENLLLGNFADLRNKPILYISSMMLDKAEVYLSRYKSSKNNNDLNEAIHIYNMVDGLINRVKTVQSEMVSKLFWRNNTRRLYEQAIEASLLENNYNAAFAFFEKSRAVLLNDQLNQLSKISNDDILRQAQVKKKILELEREQITTDPSSKQYAEIQTEIFTNKQALEQLDQTIKQKNPLYYQSFLDTSVVSLHDVQKNLLTDHQALLELFSGDSAVYVFLITPNHAYLDKIDKNDFDSTANRYFAYISNPSVLNRKFSDYIQTAAHLYQLIFRNNPIPAGRIIISPDGRYFPFEALITKTSPSPGYFLNDHAVSYTYSARYLMNDLVTNTTEPAGNFLGLAPVEYAADFSLASLQGSDFSLSRIKPYFNKSKTLIARQATKNNFLQQFSKYIIIQLYTHASDTSKNHEPVIYFTDSALYLSDLIAENKPFTRLIVLSACETGNGKFYQGEGVFGFNRGFASIGIPSSVTNLWAVDNQSTYRLTEIFYKYLSEGVPIDVALQKAKLRFLSDASKENNMPYYWAATIVAGKTNAIEYKKTYPWKFEVLTGIGIAGLAILVMWGWRRKNVYIRKA